MTDFQRLLLLNYTTHGRTNTTQAGACISAREGQKSPFGGSFGDFAYTRGVNGIRAWLLAIGRRPEHHWRIRDIDRPFFALAGVAGSRRHPPALGKHARPVWIRRFSSPPTRDFPVAERISTAARFGLDFHPPTAANFIFRLKILTRRVGF